MGQRINLESTTVLGDTTIFTTDRGFTGMDGLGYDDGDAAAADTRFPGQLAARVFATDDAVTRVFVAASDVVVTRSGGWSPESTSTVGRVVEEFFLFYRD